MRKASVKWKNWSDFKAQHSRQLRGENWSKIEILSLNSLARYRNCKNEINCMNDSRDFQDAESVRSGHSHVTSQLVSFPPHPVPGGMQSRSVGMPSRKKGRQAFGTHMVFRETFLQVQPRLLQHLIRRNWIHGVLICQNKFTHHRRRRVRTKHHFRIRDASPDRQPKIQSSLVREILQRIMWQTNNDCRSQIIISTKSTTPATFACWKIRLKTEVCTCSQFPTEAMLWIKEVEMVDSVDDLKSSCSVRGIRMPDFEVLDAMIASALNKNHPWYPVQKKAQSGGTTSTKRGPFLSWKTERWPDLPVLPSLEPTIPSRIMPTYLLLLFEMMIFRNSIRNGTEFYYQRRKSHLMTSWKDCTNWEYESLRNSRPYWNCTTWRFIRRKQDLIFTDWRQWRKEVSSKIYETGILGSEMEIMRETPWSRIGWTKQRGQRILGDCWQWESNGQCSRGGQLQFPSRYQ